MSRNDVTPSAIRRDPPLTEEESIAATLRETYWERIGETPRWPWEEASVASKAAWIAVALQARDMWEGIPRG